MAQYQYQNPQNFNPQQQYAPPGTTAVTKTMSGLLPKVYGWMFVALAISGAVAWWSGESTQLAETLLRNPLLWLLVLIAWVGLGIGISAGINKLSAGTATALFIIYSALAGLALSWIFVAYQLETIAGAFVVSAGMYGLMSVVGFAIKRDLSGLGGFFFMALMGLLLAGIVAMFIPSLWTVWTWVGLLLFLGLAVYETNVIKKQVAAYEGTGAAYERKFAIFWALQMYLTFVNIFLFVLRIMGGGNR
ncbi:MAG: Bax inhibitor-1/YccA family protein [Acidimicrobiia bacterium]|nr:Bax inhibitor-1/YccA family protein [Acidimicrobiia bacterium]